MPISVKSFPKNVVVDYGQARKDIRSGDIAPVDKQLN